MTRLSVLLTRRWPGEAEERLAATYDVTRNLEDRALSSAAIADALRAFDFICPTVTDHIDADMLAGTGIRTKGLCNFGAGVSHIDLKACAGAGIVVTNTPDVLTEDTADLAILLALMCARRAGEGERLARSGKWRGWAPTHLLGTRLSGKTMGIVGFGRIGQAVAQRASHGFGMPIVYSSRRRAPMATEQDLRARQVPIERLMADADFISLHAPGGDANHHLIDAEHIASMKRSAILINTARGEIVDQAALITALSGGVIASAGLDVYEDEPHISPALRELQNVVLLPHLGSATAETRIAMGLRVAANLDAIAGRRAPPDRVV